MPKLKIELTKTVNYFKERDTYNVKLKGWIKKYGIAGLPKSVQRTIPTDRKVLYEMKWWLQPLVWLRILQISWLNVGNNSMKEIVNG